MDIYVIMQVIILFVAIFLGVRLGGMGIVTLCDLGVVLLSLGMGCSQGRFLGCNPHHHVCYRLLFVLYNSLAVLIICAYCRRYFA